MPIILIISLLLNIILICRLIFTQGILEVDCSDELRPRWLFLLTMPTENINKYHRLVFKIKDVTEIIKEKEKLNELSGQDSTDNSNSTGISNVN